MIKKVFTHSGMSINFTETSSFTNLIHSKYSTKELRQQVTNEVKQKSIKKALSKRLDITTIADLFDVSEKTVRNIQSNTI